MKTAVKYDSVMEVFWRRQEERFESVLPGLKVTWTERVWKDVSKEVRLKGESESEYRQFVDWVELLTKPYL